MKTHQRILAVLLLVTVTTASFGCASGRRTARYARHQKLTEAQFDSDYIYEIRLKGVPTAYKVGGEAIQKEGNAIRVSTALGVRKFSPEEIEEIRGKSKEPTGSYVLLGLGIGAAVGALTGGLIARAGTDCAHSNEPSDCGALSGLWPLTAMLTGALGGVTGLAVGAIIPKKAKTTITPIVSRVENETKVGVGFGVPF